MDCRDTSRSMCGTTLHPPLPTPLGSLKTTSPFHVAHAWTLKGLDRASVGGTHTVHKD